MSLPLTKVRAAQIARVTERAIRQAIEAGHLRSVPIAEGKDGGIQTGVCPESLRAWKPDRARQRRSLRAL